MSIKPKRIEHRETDGLKVRKIGLARVLSKLGYCSRTRAAEHVRAGRVSLNGRICQEPEQPVDMQTAQILVDGHPLTAVQAVYFMLNKPRGLVTSTADEQGRATVYSLLEHHALPWVAPVGRLDKASEGLLLLSNDSMWAAHVTDPDSGIEKTYHVQIQGECSPAMLRLMLAGVRSDEGDILAVEHVSELRTGVRNRWLEIKLREGRNRHIRRLAASLGLQVLRLVRVAIGGLTLGTLAKGELRALSQPELELVSPTYLYEHARR
jgi:23S rRNA pseudouridine2605 synthase